MCNCDDNINAVQVFSGPQGPVGPQGPQGVQGIQGIQGLTGATGSQGIQGIPGDSGESAYTTATADASPVGGNLYSLTVDSTGWMAIGQVLYIEGAGYYEINNIIGPNSVILLDLQYTGNDSTNLITAAKISPGGIKGTDGFIYETTDGNGIPATSSSAYSVLIRKGDNSGYEFITLADFIIVLQANGL